MPFKYFYITTFISAISLTGCVSTTPQTTNSAVELSNQGNYKAAAASFINEKGETKYDDKALESLLLVGKVFHDAGMWQHSYDAFEKASAKLLWKADKVDTGEEFIRFVGTTLSSDAFGDYTGRIYEGVLIDYYQTINQLMLASEEKVRVHLNRSELRQENAEIQFAHYVETVEKAKFYESGRLKESEYEIVRANIKVDVNLGISLVPKASKVEIRNPMGDLLDAFFRTSSSRALDRASSKVYAALKNAASVMKSQHGTDQVFVAFKEGFEKGTIPKILVIFEDGMGPKVKEFRFDLPLFILTDDALYSGIALPKFQTGKPAKNGLQVRSGNQNSVLNNVTDINRMAGLEFEASYKKKVAKQISSVIIKTTLQVIANKEIEKRSNSYIGFLGKLTTAGLQAAATQADTRHWSNLPNTIKSTLMVNDGSGLIEFVQDGQSVTKVKIPAGKDVIVYARSAAPGVAITAYVQSFPLDEAATQFTAN